MKIVIDTNFILTCIKQKIDFSSLADELFEEEISWIVPLEVTDELKKLSQKKGEKTKDKEAAQTALDLIEKNKFEITPLGLKKGENVDEGIARYLKQRVSGKQQTILATLDKKLKDKTDVKILTIRGKSSLEVIK